MDHRQLLAALAPNRPLTGKDVRYVDRPRGGLQLARQVELDPAPVVLVGPPGVGKSTELARAAAALHQAAVAVHVPLDRFLDVRDVTADLVFTACADRVAEIAQRALHLDVEPWPSDMNAPEPQRPPLDRLLEVSRRTVRESRQGRVALLVDGLEKCPDESKARDLVLALGRVAEECNLVVVAPATLVTGPPGFQVFEGYQLFTLAPLAPAEARPFLLEILARRLAAPPPGLSDVVDAALLASGGLPRTFLSLVRGAIACAGLAGRAHVTEVDGAAAIAQHAENLRRIMGTGDKAVLDDARDANELDVAVLARLLTHGLLLETRNEEGRIGYTVHPLLRHDAA